MNKSKNNLISLSVYRKKNKLNLKKTSKMASNESPFFVDTDSHSKNLKKNKKTQIYNISDHKKRKKLPAGEGKEHSKNWGQKKESEQIHHSKSKQGSEDIISLEEYRKKRTSRQNETKKKTKPKYIAKEALSFTAMALMMLLALNVFFPSGQNPLNSKIAKNNSPNEQPSKRGLATPLKPKHENKLKDQQVIFGEKPSSSEHKGF